ncbi:hypothetical protein [Microbacterium sp. PRC9]|uniref:hypothetical protein n=1 Tax=Microbacterium sp. PRC9 TaxID=2962591 RepID=UPI002881CA24|nr:hypothetical protein [Microbacterium sp. PRC9]MDT0144606.1 hypothetical protein [Microbacterium sp. PRC9]
MKPADVLPLLRRRWYIVLPGLLLAVAAVVGAWGFVGPQYERTGTQMLLPGAANLPEGSTNPFLFISGLQLPADVLVQSVGGPDGLAAILADFPDSEVVVERAAGSAPIVRTIVTSPSDAEAEELLSLVMAHSVSVLEELQTLESIPQASRIEIVTLTTDPESTLLQRTRIVAAAATGIGVIALTLALTALVDGFARRKRRATTSGDARRESGSESVQD